MNEARTTSSGTRIFGLLLLASVITCAFGFFLQQFVPMFMYDFAPQVSESMTDGQRVYMCRAATAITSMILLPLVFVIVSWTIAFAIQRRMYLALKKRSVQPDKSSVRDEPRR